LDAGIIHIRHAIGFASAWRGRFGLGGTFDSGELADLVHHFFAAALGALGLARGLEAAREELKNPPALRTGIFKNRHFQKTTSRRP